MRIITDTREQLSYWNTDRRTLIVGDYTTVKLHGKFHIERKSLGDLYGTIVQGNQRFKRELFRAAWDQITIVMYIEGTRADFVAKRFPYGRDRKFSSDGLDKLIKTFERVYHLEFNWHRNRAHCKKEVERRLISEERQLYTNTYNKIVTKWKSSKETAIESKTLVKTPKSRKLA